MMERNQIYHIDPDILGGTPVFTGTRVPIDTLLVYLRKGKRIDDFRDDFPMVPSINAAFAKAIPGRIVHVKKLEDK